MSNLESQLHAVRDGRIHFARFVESTRREFRAMAAYLLRRWSSPEWFGLEDAEQELYLGVWKYVWSYDARRGASLARYVIFNAMGDAKRRLHVARGVPISGSPDHLASCFERTASSLGVEAGEGERIIEELLAEGTEPIDAPIVTASSCRAVASAALPMCSSAEERHAVLAIREAGSLDNAAAVLYDDVDRRTLLRLGSEERAEHFVIKHATALVSRRRVRRALRAVIAD